MSDDFIPLNQSTPLQKQWQNFYHGGNQGCWGQNYEMRGSFRKQRGNNSQINNSSRNNSNDNTDKDIGIEAYIHPSMLQDPWAYLRRKNAEKQSN